MQENLRQSFIKLILEHSRVNKTVYQSITVHQQAIELMSQKAFNLFCVD